ncbi:MAG: prolyl oligopeptidase family serine peptidase [Chitinophagaceae bacterium]|nr:prolyl oligopeptidase family serine peptidase [Chitinophagaceae bacterium]MCW5904742.1 prolyl oligopeptidase family serine peptidase [Chitinophagaceae bacterium]
MKKLFLLFIVIISFSSCKKTTDENSHILEAKTLLNVAYASNSSLQNMDVYLPANRNTSTTFPIILVHGGSWSGGDKTDFDTDITSIKSSLNNYAIFNINYRLANGTTILLQQQIDDINTAINFITSKANDYQINTTKWGILGASAGAHLALLKAYKYNTDNTIKAVVDLFGPTNMTWMYNNHPYPTFSQPIIQNVIGATPATDATAYYNASPINFVTSTAPPTIIFHGTADDVVPISESNNLKNALTTAGVTNEYYTYTGESHGWTGANLTDTHNKIITFIQNYVK